MVNLHLLFCRFISWHFRSLCNYNCKCYDLEVAPKHQMNTRINLGLNLSIALWVGFYSIAVRSDVNVPSYYVNGLPKTIYNRDNGKITFYPPSNADMPNVFYLQAVIEKRSMEPLLIIHGTYKVTCSGDGGTILPLVNVIDFRKAGQPDSPWVVTNREVIFKKFNGIIAQTDQFKLSSSNDNDGLSPEDGLILAAVCGRTIKERYSFGPEDMR